MHRHRAPLGWAGLALWLAALAGTAAAQLPADAKIRTIAYDPDAVVTLHGVVGYQIHVQFADGEEFVNLGSGDNGAFDIGAQRNHLFIKPRETRAATNLTVLTNRRAYHFDYLVSPATPGKQAAPLVYSIRFRYPDDEARAAEAERRRQALEARMRESAAAVVRNVDYAFCGDAALKPMSVWDDGVHTRLRFEARGEFPALFVRNDDGSESLLNFHVDADEVVVHRVVRRLVLRRGQLVGCVVNQAFAGGGARASSQTSVPGLARSALDEETP